jgi:hypothetical protein
MTPQEEQLAMQAYVRQQLLARQGQLNLQPGQVPLAPEDQAQFLQRPPIAPGVEPPPANPAAPPPSPFDLPAPSGGYLGSDQPSTPVNLRAVPTRGELPVQLTGGGYSMGKRFGQTSQPLSVQGGYNLPDMPIDVSGGTSLRPGRGLGGVDLRAYFRQPF